MAKPRSKASKPPGGSLADAQAELEAEVEALGKTIKQVQAQLAERRSLDNAISALLMLAKRRPKAKAKATRGRKAPR
jgi:hypothetical protein